MSLFNRTHGRGSGTANPPEGLENLRIVRCKTARRVALRVDPARCEICLVIPKRGSEKAAWRFADENRDWIEQHLAEMDEPIPFADGSVIPVFGRERTIRIIKSDKRGTDITLNDDEITVITARENPATNIKKFLYKAFVDYITPMAHGKAESVKRSIPSIQLRDTRARWGSCAPDGRMMFCWRLVFAPPIVIDYVVGHECAHLVHMNHGERFWNLCRKLTDDMDEAREWLRLNGDRLLAYGIQK